MLISEMKRQVGVNLIKLREDRDLTLEQIENTTTVSPKTYSHYEDGSYLPTVSSLFKLCEGLGVSSNEILGF